MNSLSCSKAPPFYYEKHPFTKSSRTVNTNFQLRNKIGDRECQEVFGDDFSVSNEVAFVPRWWCLFSAWSQLIRFSSLLVRLAYFSLLLPFSSTTAKPKFPWGAHSPELPASPIQKELPPGYLDASVQEANQPRACRSSGISDFKKTHPLDSQCTDPGSLGSLILRHPHWTTQPKPDQDASRSANSTRRNWKCSSRYFLCHKKYSPDLEYHAETTARFFLFASLMRPLWSTAQVHCLISR